MSGSMQDQRGNINAAEKAERINGTLEGMRGGEFRSYKVRSAEETARLYNYQPQPQCVNNEQYSGVAMPPPPAQPVLPPVVGRLGQRAGYAIEDTAGAVIEGTVGMVGAKVLSEVADGLFGGGHGHHHHGGHGSQSHYSNRPHNSSLRVVTDGHNTHVYTRNYNTYGNDHNRTTVSNSNSFSFGQGGFHSTGQHSMSNTHYGNHGTTRVTSHSSSHNGHVTHSSFGLHRKS